MVERFFRDITDKRIRRDSFTSVAELELAIDLYVAQHNIDPKPFIWTARATDILAKVTRAKAVHPDAPLGHRCRRLLRTGGLQRRTAAGLEGAKKPTFDGRARPGPGPPRASFPLKSWRHAPGQKRVLLTVRFTRPCPRAASVAVSR